jgi:hypothetical protein
VTTYPAGGVQILLGNGDGTFRLGATYALPANAFYAVTASLRNNGILDLVVGAVNADDVYVLLGNGNGTFQAAVPYPTTAAPAVISLGDFNGGGKTDLAASNGGVPPTDPPGASVFKGNGNGIFQSGAFYPVGTEEGGDYVATGDFNGDGKPDLVILNGVNSIVTTLLNTGVVSFSPTTPLNFKKQAVGKTSAPQTVALTNTGTTELKIQSMKASAEFAVTSTCGARVAPGAKCTISATFSPTKQGEAQGTISIIDNASSKPQVIELLGTGT